MSDLQTGDASQDLAAARLVRRVVAQWWLVLLCALLAGVAAYLFASREEESFQSTTSIQLNDVDLASVFLGQSLQQQGLDADMKAATAARVAAMPAVMKAASQDLGGTVSPGVLRGRVSVAARSDTTLIDITSTASNPNLAARQANAVRRAFIRVRREASAAPLVATRIRLMTLYDGLTEQERAGAAGYNLRNRRNQLDTLITSAGSGVMTVQEATPSKTPVGPRPKRAAILGLLAGGLLGLGIALLRARLDDRIRDVRELSEHWDLPVLGVIPQIKDPAGASLLPQAALEAFALARTNLRYLQLGSEVKTLVVTSALAGEGKSTVAWNLAVASAVAEQRVLLIDADLRRPVLAERLGIDSRRGLSDLLAGLAEPAEVVNTVKVPFGGVDAIEVDVIGSGFVPPSPISLIERAATGTALEQLAKAYDVVIIDTPPSTLVADAKVLMSHADGALVVSRLGLVTGAAIDRMRAILSGLDTPVLGTVVQSSETTETYGYTSHASTLPVPPRPTPRQPQPPASPPAPEREPATSAV